MRTLVYLRSAEDDLNRIARGIARRGGSVRIAMTFADRLRRRCERLADLGATIGTARPEYGHELRSVSERGYLILFRYARERLEIIRVLNGARDAERATGGR